MVDEAIYSLYPDSSGDMVQRLYPQRYAESQVDSSLDYYFSGEAGTKSPMLAMRNARYRPQLAQVKPGNEAEAAGCARRFRILRSGRPMSIRTRAGMRMSRSPSRIR